MSKRDGGVSFIAILAVVILGIILVRNACIIEDAYITFRTIDNFAHGYGLRWNPAERVQTYTHPLWMMVMTAGSMLTQNLYLSCVAISILLTLLTFGIITFKLAASSSQVIPVFLALSLSKAFIDFSVSGLENPLTHLLVALFAVGFLTAPIDNRRLFYLSLSAGLATLNRMDNILLFAPALMYCLVKRRSIKAIGLVALGFTPFIAWVLFSLFYYGLAFPNTAYAKLNTGIPDVELIQQGCFYILNSLNLDPITLLTILICSVVVIMNRDRAELMLIAGIAVHTLYVIKIGGCFMSGRFFAASLVLAVIPLARRNLPPVQLICLAFPLLVMGLGSPRNPWLSDAAYGKSASTAINYRPELDTRVLDERGTYYELSGLLNYRRSTIWPAAYWAMEGRKAKEQPGTLAWRYNSGYFGYFAGPEVHVVEMHGLCDPLLARLPTLKKRNWIVGHFVRPIPEGYAETLASGRNLLKDPKLAQYYDKLLLITRGDLFGFNRLREIVKLNLGRYDHLIDDDYYRHYSLIKIAFASVAATSPAEKLSRARGVAFEDFGIEVAFEQLSHARGYELGLWGFDQYWVEYVLNDEVIGKGIAGTGEVGAQAARIELVLNPSPTVAARGITALRVYPYYRYTTASHLYYLTCK